MKGISKAPYWIAIGALCGVSAEALATNGYFAHGYGTKTKALAGAAAALPQDSMAAATNPAGMALVGNRTDLGAALFSPTREYTVSGGPSGADNAFSVGPQNVESDNELFLIPHLGINWMLDERSSFGITVYGNGGMNTLYEGGTATFDVNPAPHAVMNMTAPGTFGAGDAGVDLSQLFVALTYARKFGEGSAWGVSPILAVERFSAKGLRNFGGFVADGVPDNLSNNGYDYAYGAGAKVGVQSRVSPRLDVGASVQSRIYMTEFDDYSDMFAERGDVDIPPTATVGLAFHTSETSVLSFDVQRIWYGQIASIANPISNLTAGCFSGDVGQCLGGSDGAGFGWRDMTVYKIGYQWQTGDWTWRAGFSTGKQPVPSSEVLINILSPGIMEEHYTLGFTKRVGRTGEFSFAALYSPSNAISGPNPFDPTQRIELEMQQFELEASWAWLF